MLATIRDDTWNVLNIQHITPNLKRWDYSDILGGSHKKIEGPVYMLEGGHHLRKAPNLYLVCYKMHFYVNETKRHAPIYLNRITWST